MTHPDEITLIDLLDGHGSDEQHAHVERCDTCRPRLAVLRSTMARVAGDEVPDPSPLFWQCFSRHVNERIDAPVESAWTRWLKAPRVAAIVAAAAVVVAVVTGTATLRSPGPAAVPVSVPTVAAQDDVADDVEADGAWAVVRMAAEDLDYDEAQAQGISARPGAAEHAVAAMTGEERAELARLIEDELKRTGA
jgi:hypothetical protein